MLGQMGAVRSARIHPMDPPQSRGGVGRGAFRFLFWGNKVFGLQASTLAKRFYAVRFGHVTEGNDDSPLRARRVKALLKASKLRGARCKKIPFNTDLLRKVRNELDISGPCQDVLNLTRLRAGLLVAFSSSCAFRGYWL